MNFFLLSAAVIWLFMTLLWFLALYKKDNSLADVGWGPGFVLVFWVLWLASEMQFKWSMQLLVGICISFWGIRLGLHIGKRHWGREEDFRYQKWRKEWGSSAWWRAYLKVFLLQGLMMFLISLPSVIALRSPVLAVSWWGWLGLGVFAIGFFFEVVGDFQLTQFKKDSKNKGRLMTSGLWAYTRHPNYFGEALLWWGIFLMVIPFEWGMLAIISPLLIDCLLLYVSGIPMLEKKYEGNAEFEVYKKRTNAFWPWFPKEVQE